MKNAIIIFFLLSIGFNNDLFSQVIKNNNTVIYESLLKQLKIRDSIPIYNKTSLDILKQIDFKTTNIHRWLGQATVAEVKTFFQGVNINALKESELTIKIGAHPFTGIAHSQINNEWQPVLALSPIIFSEDKNLAICAVYEYYGPEASSETIYLLRLKNGIWEYVNFLPISIS
jgi:hypothetical protein